MSLVQYPQIEFKQLSSQPRLNFEINAHCIFLSVMTMCCCLMLYFVANLTNKRSISSLYNKRHESDIQKITVIGGIALLCILVYVLYYLFLVQNQTLRISVLLYCIISGITIVIVLVYCRYTYNSVENQVLSLSNRDTELAQQLWEMSVDMFGTSWFILIGLLMFTIIQFSLNYTLETKLAQQLSLNLPENEYNQLFNTSNLQNLIRLEQIDYAPFAKQGEKIEEFTQRQLQKLNKLQDKMKYIQQQKVREKQLQLQLMEQEENLKQEELERIEQERKATLQTIKDQEVEAEQIIEAEMIDMMKQAGQFKVLDEKLKQAINPTEKAEAAAKSLQFNYRAQQTLSGLTSIMNIFKGGPKLFQSVADRTGFTDFWNNWMNSSTNDDDYMNETKYI